MASARTFRLVPASSLHVSRPTNWLTSRFHFSFADYFNPDNTNFGVLRVLNDDLVTARNGFGTHPHRDQEIFSYIVDGQLTHQDSEGNKESLGRGSVQYMSAGRGVWHSEMNEGGETCRFLQIWITPERKGLPVQYGSHRFDEQQRKNKLLQVIKGTRSEQTSDEIVPITLQQDTNVYVSELDLGQSVDLALGADRQAYMVCIEGSATINEGAVNLGTRDGLEIVGPAELTITPSDSSSDTNTAHFMIIEMPKA